METLGQRLGDHCRLVISAFALAAGVQWYRNYDVGAKSRFIVAESLLQTGCEPLPKRYKAFIFEQGHGRPHGLMVGAKAASTVKAIHSPPAEMTDGLARQKCRRGEKRSAAQIAHDCRERLHFTQALGTDRNECGAGENFTANPARRRKEHGSNRIGDGSQAQWQATRTIRRYLVSLESEIRRNTECVVM